MGTTRSRPPRVKTAIVFAAVCLGLGIAWLHALEPSHSACSSVLVNAFNASACQSDSLRWYLALALIGVGIVLVLVALIEHNMDLRAGGGNLYCVGCGRKMEASASFCKQCGAASDRGPRPSL